MTRFFWIYPSLAAALLFAGGGPAHAQEQNVDPPQRVARMAYSAGDVEFAPAGTDTWGTASRNRPLITGDRLLTGGDGRAALELGDAAARIDDNSAFSFLRMDQQVVQIELSQGTMNLRVRQIYGQQVYEIDTPTLAFVASQAGSYRIDVAPDGRGAMVTVFEGSGIVFGTNNTQRNVDADRQYRFDDSDVSRVTLRDIPRGNAFDRFCAERDAQYADSTSRRYVADNVVGYQDLDRYGNWQTSTQYGEIWYPRDVRADWAPYRDGHWAWIDPWGWTWVDNAPWGFAPFHYGRWAYVGSRWGWVPGPRTQRAIYAPALVAFVGGAGFSVSISSGPVGWFPLGPRDIYLPPYQVSQRYFTAINVTNIRVVNRTVINHYYNDYHNHRRVWRDDYTYRHHRDAVTVVPRNVFTGARPVAAGALRLRPDQLASSGVALRPTATPSNASLGVMPRGQPGPSNAAFARKVIARHTPAPAIIPFEQRVKAVATHGGAPLTNSQRDTLRRSGDVAHPRVDVLQRTQPRGAPATTRNPTPANTPAARNAPRGIPMPSSRPPAHAPVAPRVTTTAPDTSRTQPRTLPRGTPAPLPPRVTTAPRTTTRNPPAMRPAPVKTVQPRAPAPRPQVQRVPEVRQPAPRIERVQPPVRTPAQREPVQRVPVQRAPPPVIERRAPVQQPQRATPVRRVAAPPQRAEPRGKPAKAQEKKHEDESRVHVR